MSHLLALSDAIATHARLQPGKLGARDSRRALTFAQWDERASRLAQGLGALGLRPGDRWCVTARNWLRAHGDGAAAPVVLAATNAAVLDLVPLEVLRSYAVDVPPDASTLLK